MTRFEEARSAYSVTYKKTCEESKIRWFSPNKLVFSYEFREPCRDCGSKTMLIVAERGQSLCCFKCMREMADLLCWYCENGFSWKLLDRGPRCLLGEEREAVKFCGIFKPGIAFGEDMKKDMGERRKNAEEVLSKKRFEHCTDCEHWNTDNVIGSVFRGGKQWFVHYPEAAFCEAGEENPRMRIHWRNPCKNFKLTQNPERRASLEKEKRRLQEYMKALRLAEGTEQSGEEMQCRRESKKKKLRFLRGPRP